MCANIRLLEYKKNQPLGGFNMNLQELIDIVADETSQPKTTTRKVIKSALDTILEEVTKGGRVSIVGFGAFYQISRKGRIGRNPQTGEVVKIKTTKVPRFRAGKVFRALVKKRRIKKEEEE